MSTSRVLANNYAIKGPRYNPSSALGHVLRLSPSLRLPTWLCPILSALFGISSS